MAGNFFDQFDAPAAPPSAAPTAAGPNFFDQYDASPAQSALAQQSPAYKADWLRRAALIGRSIGEGVVGIPAAFSDAITGKTATNELLRRWGVSQQVPTAAGGFSEALTAAGAPVPETSGEQLAAAATRGAAGALAGGGLTGVPGVLRAAAGGATGGMASEGVRQLGGGEVAQFAAGIAGGMLPYAGSFRAPPPTPEQVVSRLNTPQSMGAAAAAPSLQKVSPELRQAISQSAQKNGGAINPEALARHIDADTLPVPMRISEGQALQDPMIISQEMNTRGSSKFAVEQYADQSKRLAQNVQAIRDEVGPDVFSTNAAEHGDALIAAYKAKDAAAQKQITADYKALKDANGGQFPVDAKALLDSASAQLHQGLLFDHAPKAIMSTLSRLAEKNSMTFENFESLRTNLARIQRSLTADGNEKAAAGVIRNAMENLPLATEAAALKPLADKARASAKAQFDAIGADPAYKAAVTESVTPDRFVNRFVINGARDDVALMRQNLASNDRAIQTMGVAALDHLREAARLNPHYEGNFAAVSFNKGLQALAPKIQSLLSPQTTEQLEKLGRVAGYTTAQPRGSFVNNSNTAVALAADYGAKTAEHAVNSAAGGLPVGTLGRKAIEKLTAGRAARNAFAPGAGLGRLQPTPQVQAMVNAARARQTP